VKFLAHTFKSNACRSKRSYKNENSPFSCLSLKANKIRNKKQSFWNLAIFDINKLWQKYDLCVDYFWRSRSLTHFFCATPWSHTFIWLSSSTLHWAKNTISTAPRRPQPSGNASTRTSTPNHYSTVASSSSWKLWAETQNMLCPTFARPKISFKSVDQLTKTGLRGISIPRCIW